MLVTGGAHRVGKAIALLLAGMGADTVVFTYHSAEDFARETMQEIQQLGCQALSIRCDQGYIGQIYETMAIIRERLGRLDVLVNSASIFGTSDFFSVTPETWDTVLDVNARGPFFFMQEAARIMQGQDAGLIINIIDESVKKPALTWIHHGASKAALWNLTQSAAIALAPKIRVNAILPGAVLKPPDWDDTRWKKLQKHIPLQVPGSPEDVCKAVKFLVESDFVTGQAVVVDGGATVV